jgi:hypothetical protein
MALANETERLADRQSEWFVPKFGPRRFRVAVGLLFLPYTGMVLSYTVIGSALANEIHRNRLVAIVLVYFLGLGIGAHALDALGSKISKPWGNVFSKRQLWLLAMVSLILAYGTASYFMIKYAPLLCVIAILEGFFLFAYNLEWFNGMFHTDGWFAFSWGFLPVLAGYIIQTNRLSVEVLMVGLSTSFFSLIEIKISRPYKDLKRGSRSLTEDERQLVERYENVLKSVSLGVCLLGAALIFWRLTG